MTDSIPTITDGELARALATVSCAIRERSERTTCDVLYSYIDELRNDLLGVNDLEPLLDGANTDPEALLALFFPSATGQRGF